jgi:hypothetical protein
MREKLQLRTATSRGPKEDDWVYTDRKLGSKTEIPVVKRLFMRMPGFEAEASLSNGSQRRTVGPRNYQEPAESSVQPALLRGCLLNCEQICEGDFIGACLPWCVCRCHGGKNCGFPS